MQEIHHKYMRTICISCAALAIIACFNLHPYYYLLLRIILFASSLYIIITDSKSKSDFKAVAFIAIALLFNPIIPIYLAEKKYWLPIDLITSLLFLTYGFKEKTTN